MSKVDIALINEFHNKLLDRHELTLKVSHPESSFKKDQIKSFIQKKYSSTNYVCGQSRTEFGKTETKTFVRVYNTNEQFEKIEDFYVLHKLGLKKKEKAARRTRKDKRKRRVASWGTQKRQDKKAERKQK